MGKGYPNFRELILVDVNGYVQYMIGLRKKQSQNGMVLHLIKSNIISICRIPLHSLRDSLVGEGTPSLTDHPP